MNYFSYQSSNEWESWGSSAREQNRAELTGKGHCAKVYCVTKINKTLKQFPSHCSYQPVAQLLAS